MSHPNQSSVSIPVRVMRARSALQSALLTAEQEKAVTDALNAVSELFATPPIAVPASFAATSIDAYMRLISLFDQNEVAGAFLQEDGEGGFVGAVYGMAKELERRQQHDIRAAFAEDVFGSSDVFARLLNGYINAIALLGFHDKPHVTALIDEAKTALAEQAQAAPQTHLAVVWTSQYQLDEALNCGMGFIYGEEGKPEKADIPLMRLAAGHSAADVVAKIAQVATAVGLQANEPAMEMAGQIVSVLAANPEHIDRFMAEGSELFLDGTLNHENGSLTYRAINGSILSPSVLREKKGQQQ